MKFLTWFQHPTPKASNIERPKLEPFFFFPHGSQHGQLDRALRRLCGQIDDERTRQVVKMFARGPDLIPTRIGNRKIFVNSRD